MAWITPPASAHPEMAQVENTLPASLPSGVSAGAIYTTTINYDYDPLYRLTDASYGTGEYFAYTYDPVGNRLTQQTLAGINTYLYDSANRLTSVDGITYTWDDNGNLLHDGVNTYSYDHANRLKSVTRASLTASYAYNGLGDRVQQFVNGVPETYLLDITGSLIQVLQDEIIARTEHQGF